MIGGARLTAHDAVPGSTLRVTPLSLQVARGLEGCLRTQLRTETCVFCSKPTLCSISLSLSLSLSRFCAVCPRWLRSISLLSRQPRAPRELRESSRDTSKARTPVSRIHTLIKIQKRYQNSTQVSQRTPSSAAVGTSAERGLVFVSLSRLKKNREYISRGLSCFSTGLSGRVFGTRSDRTSVSGGEKANESASSG